MKKIFLSLGFSGRSEEDVMNEINSAIKVISSMHENEELDFIHNYHYIDDNRIRCLGEAIKKMSECDEVYFINDWQNYKGCTIERTVCCKYGIECNDIVL